jgi:hypothetical protein
MKDTRRRLIHLLQDDTLTTATLFEQAVREGVLAFPAGPSETHSVEAGGRRVV